VQPRTIDSATTEQPRSKPPSGTRGVAAALLGRLFGPVDIASLVFFRVAFGVLMVVDAWRYWSYGWVQTSYIDPAYHFKYYGFGWVNVWPGDGLYVHFLALMVLASFVALGLWYRLSAALFFLGFTYFFLLDQTTYLNHFYLICLISFLMIFVPANRAFSVDALRKPQIRSETAPAWALWVLAAQMGIAYFYGGLAKLNGDWLRGEPMRDWMAQKSADFPLVGPLFTEEWMVYLFSYGGLLFDLLIVPFLLWRRTRLVAFAVALAFHLTNWQLFNIEVFPFLAIGATTLFFAPSWPRRLVGHLRGLFWADSRPAAAPSGPGHEEKEKEEEREARGGQAPPAGPPTGLRSRRQWVIASLLGAYLLVQLLVPLRHFLYPGSVTWTQEGQRFAWHMKLYHVEGEALLYATDPMSGRTWEIDPGDYLTPLQYRFLVRHPDMLLQFAHYTAEELRAQGYEGIEIRADVVASLNRRYHQPLVDPTVDLAQQPRTLAPAPWIVPLEEPLLPPEEAQYFREHFRGAGG
jgi:vitamin K-dependent gamma-carboxylase